MEKKDQKKHKEIELRSEEVQEVMGKIPPWIQRWGITVVFFIVMALFVDCYFFKYPDTLVVEATVTTTTPPVNIIARSTGKLDRVNVHNRQGVSEGDVLAVIQNTADFEDIIGLKEKVTDWIHGKQSLDQLCQWMEHTNMQLGEIQGLYADFLKCVQEYLHYQQQNYFQQKIKMKIEQQAKQEEVFEKQKEKQELVLNLMEISQSIFNRDSILHAKQILTREDYDHSLQNYLQSKQSMLNRETSKKQMEMQQIQSEESLLDLENQYSETRNLYNRALYTSTDQLLVGLKNWEQNYVLHSSISGVVNSMGIWSPNQNVTTGELVFIILPSHPDVPIGKALLPAAGAGKVQVGQRVNVHLNNFPDQEFGYVIGEVRSISSVLTEDAEYLIEIGFPKGFKTNYGRELPIMQQMVGNAQIIIQDKRLLERFFEPVRKLLSEHDQK